MWPWRKHAKFHTGSKRLKDCPHAKDDSVNQNVRQLKCNNNYHTVGVVYPPLQQVKYGTTLSLKLKHFLSIYYGGGN